jgi:hypothetical protein
MYWYPTSVNLTFNFQVYEAAGYMYQWYLDGNLLGDTQYVWFDEIKTSGTELSVDDFRGSSGNYTVEVWLLKSNGHKISGAYIFAVFKSF